MWSRSWILDPTDVGSTKACRIVADEPVGFAVMSFRTVLGIFGPFREFERATEGQQVLFGLFGSDPDHLWSYD